MNAFAGIRPKGGQNPTPLAFFPWRLQWGLSVFQWGSNPPPIFTMSDTKNSHQCVTAYNKADRALGMIRTSSLLVDD